MTFYPSYNSYTSPPHLCLWWNPLLPFVCHFINLSDQCLCQTQTMKAVSEGEHLGRLPICTLRLTSTTASQHIMLKVFVTKMMTNMYVVWMKASLSNLFVSDRLFMVCNLLEKCIPPLSGFDTEPDKQMTSLHHQNTNMCSLIFNHVMLQG